MWGDFPGGGVIFLGGAILRGAVSGGSNLQGTFSKGQFYRWGFFQGAFFLEPFFHTKPSVNSSESFFEENLYWLIRPLNMLKNGFFL